MKKELLTTQEIAQVLRVSDQTVRNYIDEYRLPYIKIGRQKRFELDKVLKRLEAQGHQPEVEQKQKSKITVEVKKPDSKYRKLLDL